MARYGLKTRGAALLALLVGIVFAFSSVALAQDQNPEPTQITDPVVLEGLLEGDLSVLEGEGRSVSAGNLGYSIRLHPGYGNLESDGKFQIYVNNSERDHFTGFFIEATLQNGVSVPRVLWANMTPVATYYDRNGQETDLASINVRMSDSGRTDSTHNSEVCPDGPMIVMNRQKGVSGRAFPVVSNRYSGKTMYYRIPGFSNWRELPDGSTEGWAVYSDIGSIEVAMEPSDNAPLCVSASWDWTYQEVPVGINIPDMSWDPSSFRTVPVDLTDVNDREVTDFRFVIRYPSSFATYVGMVMGEDFSSWMTAPNVEIDQDTGITTLTIGGSTQGVPITTDGLLVNLTFARHALPVREEIFTLTDTLVNGGNLFSIGSDAVIEILPYTAAGEVTHVNGEPFPNVGVNLSGSTTQAYTQTLVDGSFSLQSVETGAHNLGFGYDTRLATQAINHSDASTILRCSVGAEDCQYQTANVDGDQIITPHDTYVLVQELLGNSPPESQFGHFECNPPRFDLNLTFSQYGLKATCWLVGDANNSVLPGVGRSALTDPLVEFGQQVTVSDVVTVPLTISQMGLDGATIDLVFEEGLELVDASAKDWETAHNSQRIIVFGQDRADQITIALAFRGEGTVRVANLQTLGKIVYADMAETKVAVMNQIFLPTVQR